MSEEIINIRLSKAAKEFNVGTSTIVEFLAKKGFNIAADCVKHHNKPLDFGVFLNCHKLRNNVLIFCAFILRRKDIVPFRCPC